MRTTVLFDIDGTLVDSNDAHAAAWVKAFASEGIAVDPQQVRRAIGMGGDKLLPHVSGIAEDTPAGQRIARHRAEIFLKEFVPTLTPFRDAAPLVQALTARGLTCVAATSAKRDELAPLLRIAGVEHLLDAKTTSDDANESKPAPDIVQAALARAKARPQEAILIGDTPYDLTAAARAGVAMIAFRTGGWRDEDLRGAVEIYDGPWQLLEELERSPLVE